MSYHAIVTILLSIYYCSASTNVSRVYVHFPKERLHDFRTYSTQLVRVNLTTDSREDIDAFVHIDCEHRDICHSINYSLPFHLFRGNNFADAVIVNLSANFLGDTTLVVDGKRVDPQMGKPLNFIMSEPFKFSVLRSIRGKQLSTIFTIFVKVVIVINTFMMGTQLDIRIILGVTKKPIGPAIGFCCQYGVMPLIAYLGAILLLEGYPGLQIGFFAVGCSPGGGQSNFWTILFKGNINLSVAMTFFSNIGAIGMLPLWMYTLGKEFFQGEVDIPFVNLLTSLLYLIIPCIIGMVFIYFRSQWVKHFEKVLNVMSLLIVTVFTAMGIYSNLYIVKLITWRILLVGAVLPLSGYIVAFGTAAVFQQPFKDRITIAIETGIQNAMIAVLICRNSLPEPSSDLTVVMPICVFLLTSVPLIFILIVIRLRNRFWTNISEFELRSISERNIEKENSLEKATEVDSMLLAATDED